ncbi:kinase-like domain-containing protein [Suillus ampliporus]|nr:kinase-like domain-containing protein [Suillus ampliporus]
MSFRARDCIGFAMPLMANDLHHYIVYEPAYTRVNACRWSAQTALGINALHNMGIIHRDIKIENVLIGPDENVKITDFGVSYVDREPLYRFKNYSSEVKGTTHCMAPEILSNKKKPGSTKYGIAVDWWAFGCILYELLSPHHWPLFATVEAVADYVSWHSSNYEMLESFPAFDDLDPSVVSLVEGLLRPEAIFRFGFQSVQDHPWFFSNGASEFDYACYRARWRIEWPEMLPDFNLPYGVYRKPEYLIPLPAEPSDHRSKCTLDVDWRNPRSGVVSFRSCPSVSSFSLPRSAFPVLLSILLFYSVTNHSQDPNGP